MPHFLYIHSILLKFHTYYLTMLNNEIKKYITKSVLCWLATSNEHNIPNVSPKEMFTYYDDATLLIANIASPNSINNILINQNVCVAFIDVFVQKGYKLIGKAKIHYKGTALFEVYKVPIIHLFGDQFPISAIIEIQISDIYNIKAPSYVLYPEITEATQIENAMKIYNVKPIKENTH